MTAVDQSSPPSHIYCFDVGAGVWRGNFTFQVTSWPRLLRSDIGPVNRILVTAMHVGQLATGSCRLDSTIVAKPSAGEFGEAVNTVRLSRFGVTLYELNERYSLDADGRRVVVYAHERFGPLPGVLTRRFTYPAEIRDHGMGSTYHMPLLGAPWTATYDVADDRRALSGKLVCDWAEATEAAARTSGRVGASVNNEVWHRTLPESPAGKVARVAERLAARVAKYDAARDSRATFAYAYYGLTASLATALRAGDPPFKDPAWVAELSYLLASTYFAAMDRIDAWQLDHGVPRDREVGPDDLPRDIPQPWRDVFAASSIRRSYVLEDVLFSMMAHISYDLPVTMNDMGDDADRHDHVADFHLVNDVLGSDIDEVQQYLAARYSYGLTYLDRLFARDDEILTNYGIRLARGVAWYNVDRLRDTQAMTEAMRSISRSTAAFIAEIRRQDDWRSRWALYLLRLLVPERRRWPTEHP